MCQHNFQSRENEPCHVLCSSCPYFEVGVARTVPNSHVIVFCSISVLKIRSAPNSKWSSLLVSDHLRHTRQCVTYLCHTRGFSSYIGNLSGTKPNSYYDISFAFSVFLFKPSHHTDYLWISSIISRSINIAGNAV